MSKKIIFLCFLLFPTFLLIGQPQVIDSLYLKSLRTYSEAELVQKVNEVYECIDLKDSISIYELYQNLEFEKIHEQINLDSIILRVDWNEVLKDYDWNQMLEKFDWNQMFADLCASKDSMLSQSQTTFIQGESMMAMPNIANCMSMSMHKSMQAMDMTCMMQKMAAGKITMDMFSLEGMCEMAVCMDLSTMYEDTDWNCVFRQFDMNEYMKQYDFKELLKNYDTLQTKEYLPNISQQINTHPILHQLNPDSLFNQTKANPAELFNIPEISTVYQNLYENIIAEQWQSKLLQNKSQLKSNLELFAAFMHNYFDDKTAIKYYVTFSWLLYEMNINAQNFQFEKAYEQQLVLKDILIHAINNNLFSKLNKDGVGVEAINGENFEWESLTGLYQNLGYSVTQMGRFQEAIQYLEQGIQLRAYLMDSLNPTYSVNDYLQYTYSDHSSRLDTTDSLNIPMETFDVYQLMLIHGQHPPFIQTFINNGQYAKASKRYLVLKDILLDRNATNSVRVNFVPPNKLLDKVYGLKVLKGLYKNLADIETQNPNRNQINLEKYQQASMVFDKFVHQQNSVLSYHEIGNTYKLMRNFEKSLDNYTKAWTLLQELENLDYLVWVLPGVGDFEKDYLNKMLLHVAVATNISNLHFARKDYETAGKFLEKSIIDLEKVYSKELSSPAKAKVINFDRDLFPIYANLGKIYLVQQKSEETDYYFKKCQQITNTWQLPLHIYYNAFNLGEYHQYLQQPDSAFHYYRLAAQEAKKLDFEHGLANTFFRQGLLYQQSNQLNKALSYYDSCEVIANNLALYDLRSGIQTLRGYLAKKANKPQQALTHFKSAINIIENDIFSNVFGERSRQLALENTFNAYTGAVSTALQLGQEEEAFQYVQQAKARTFNELLTMVQSDTSAKMNTLGIQLDKLLVALDKNKSKLINLRGTTNRDSIKEEQDQLLRELEIVKLEIISLKKDYIKLSNPKIASIQKMLFDEAFIEYFIGDTVYAFVITTNNFKVYPLVSSIEITDKMKDFKVLTDEVEASLTSVLHQEKSLNNFWNPKGALYKILTTTYQSIFEPIRKDGILKNVKELVFSPDGDLYFLPFEMLITSEEEKENWSDYQYLLDDFPTSYYQSATTFYQNKIKNTLQKPIAYEKNMLFVGVSDFGYDGFSSLNLPELNFPSQKDDQTVFLVKEEATLNRFLNLDFKKYRTIYVSTHGIIDPIIPELSYLALTDEPLSLYNFNKLNLNCETMILSACQTGRGHFRRGSGLRGFTQELMSAGAKSLIISLWSVEEQTTAQLFKPHFTPNNSKINALKSLHKQKLALKKAKQPVGLYNKKQFDNLNSAHPFFWASFVYFGMS